MIKISVDKSRLKGLQGQIKRADAVRRRKIGLEVRYTTIRVHKDAVESISKKGAGETYELYQPRRTHTASAPNNPPATDTGFLKNNLRWETIRSEFTGKVISGASYSMALEFGYQGNNLEKRPFMRPALEKNMNQFVNNLKKILK